VELAVAVKAPPVDGRYQSVPAPSSYVLPAERPLNPTVGVDGAVASTLTVWVVVAMLPTLSVPVRVKR
jgi:hypothetical protein